MKFTAKQIAAVVQGKIEGDEDAVVYSLAKIEEDASGALCFLANSKYEKFLYTSKASIVIVNEDLEVKEEIGPTIIRVKDAYASFGTLLKMYEEITKELKEGIHPTASIAENARIGSDVYIGAGCCIDEHARIEDGALIYPNSYIGSMSKVGSGTIIYAGVKVYKMCEIGKNCIIHSGTVIGCDGFGFAPQEDGSYQKLPQLGNVVIEDEVEIGANCTIDRATMGSTRIEKGAKLDNLIQIAHNAVIGAHTVIAAQAGISGSAKIGRNNMIGGQAGIVGHISLADGTKVNAQSGVTKGTKQPNQALNGSPAFEYQKALRAQVVFKKLPELQERIAEMEKIVDKLQNPT